MKYKELIEAMNPYENEEVDACYYPADGSITFWYGQGEGEIVTVDTHE